MSYREDERLKAISKREAIFKDSGNGLFFGKERDFVLSNPILNLWDGIRYDAINYFEENKIVWWQGKANEPTGHLLSSQIACINHLYYLRQRKNIATAVLQYIDSDIVEAQTVDNGFVEFEFIGKKQYLKEKSFQRGANCTSIDAVMIGLKKDGSRKMFFIEWKYTETYASEPKYIPARAKVYDALIQASDSPFINLTSIDSLYYEPFYQLMRQTLLAEACVKNHDHNISSYTHVHVVPEMNTELKNKITSPDLKGVDIHDAWKSLLKDSSKFIVISPESLLSSASKICDSKSFLNYLKARYWE